MTETHASTEDHYEPGLYEIRIKGHLDDRWADRFEGLTFIHESDGTTILDGPLTDQAALHGVLNGIRDLGLPIISVQCVSPDKNGSKKMKAIVYHNYGSPDVLELKEIQKPVVKDDEVLVRVHAASVNPMDGHHLRGTPFMVRIFDGLLRPKRKILGQDVAGRVEAIGVNVKQFQPGDEIFGLSLNLGAFAEYLCVPEDEVVLKSASITFEDAAALPSTALTALQGLRDKGQIQPGQKVLINGASGSMGTFAVQIAKSFAAEVTGVCSTRNLDLVRSIGADRVIDYTQEDFTQNGARYDLILDTVGNRSVADCKRALSPKGTYVDVVAVYSPVRMLQVMWGSMTGSNGMVFFVTNPNQKDLVVLRELLEAGKVTPVIDRRYPLSEVPEAIRYVEKGHARGKVLITV